VKTKTLKGSQKERAKRSGAEFVRGGTTPNDCSSTQSGEQRANLSVDVPKHPGSLREKKRGKREQLESKKIKRRGQEMELGRCAREGGKREGSNRVFGSLREGGGDWGRQRFFKREGLKLGNAARGKFV